MALYCDALGSRWGRHPTGTALPSIARAQRLNLHVRLPSRAVDQLAQQVRIGTALTMTACAVPFQATSALRLSGTSTAPSTQMLIPLHTTGWDVSQEIGSARRFS